MFPKLYNKVKIIIILTMSIAILISATVAFTGIKKLIYDNYRDLAVEYVNRKNQNIGIYMNLIEETTKYATSDGLLVDSLERGSFNSGVITVLDGLRNSNLNILGATIYTTNDLIYTSSNISSVPPLETIIENELSAAFINNPDDKNHWIIHHAKPNQYPQWGSIGMMTHIYKIYSADNNILGYMLVDTDIKALEKIFSSNGKEFFQLKEFNILIEDNSILMPSHNMDNYLQMIPKDSHGGEGCKVAYQDRKNLILLAPLPSLDHEIFLQLSLVAINARFNRLIVLLVFISLLFVILSYFLADFLAKSIAKPLDSLHSEMESQHTCKG